MNWNKMDYWGKMAFVMILVGILACVLNWL